MDLTLDEYYMKCQFKCQVKRQVKCQFKCQVKSFGIGENIHEIKSSDCMKD